LVAHPDAKEFRFKSLEHYDEMHQIFDGNIATGAYVKLPGGKNIATYMRAFV
jgi:hypothetical protein